jgi:hypothetical protein
VLDAFLTLLRLAVALVIVAIGVSALRRAASSAPPDGDNRYETRCYLLFLLGFLLLGANLASWPVLYLLLQSYIPQWPGVMCIYGVTQIGAGSEGLSRYLPVILTVLQITKPLMIFGSGAWLILYLVNRGTHSSPVAGGVVLVATAVGLLAVFDSALEGAYLTIPKEEEWLSAGCCTSSSIRLGSASSAPVYSIGDRPLLSVACLGGNLAIIAVLSHSLRRRGAESQPVGLAVVLIAALVMLLVDGIFVTEVAAPILLRLPYHHCAYDLISAAPVAIVAITLAIAGTFAVGWACVASWWARNTETEPFLDETIGWVLSGAFWCYLCSLLLMSIELAVT